MSIISVGRALKRDGAVLDEQPRQLTVNGCTERGLSTKYIHQIARSADMFFVRQTYPRPQTNISRIGAVGRRNPAWPRGLRWGQPASTHFPHFPKRLSSVLRIGSRSA